jgi:photosystem II stability/assembly factor-like uncharacterized protein
MMFLFSQFGCKENSLSPLAFSDTTWINLGLNNVGVTSIVVKGDNIIAGGGSFGAYIFVSTDKGQSWRLQYNPPSNTINLHSYSYPIPSVTFFIEGINLYAGVGHAFGGSISVSTDNGITWKQKDPDFTQNINCFAAIGTTIYVGTDNGVFISYDNGSSWNVSNPKLSQPINYLCVLGTTLFAATGENGIFSLANNGNSWIPTNFGLPNTFINGLVVAGKDIFAGVYQPPGNSSGGVYVSTNNGNSWTACNNGLTNHEIGVLSANGSNLFAGTLNGLYFSDNRGKLWTDISYGTKIDSLGVYAITTYGSYLLVASNGIWLYPLSSN